MTPPGETAILPAPPDPNAAGRSTMQGSRCLTAALCVVFGSCSDDPATPGTGSTAADVALNDTGKPGAGKDATTGAAADTARVDAATVAQDGDIATAPDNAADSTTPQDVTVADAPAIDATVPDGTAADATVADTAPDLVAAFTQTLSGKWMSHQIGNCIDFEEWWLLGPPTGFQQVIVDRDACGPHSVKKTLGNLKVLGGQVVELEWQPKDAWNKRRFTAHVADPMPGAPPAPMQKDYLPGKRALNRMAYVFAAAGGKYAREDRHETALNPAVGLQVRVFTAQIGFGKLLQAVESPTPCTMTVTLNASWDKGDGVEYAAGSETFVLPCTQGKTANGWQRVTANGFEQSQISDAWSKFFEQKGIWKKYKAVVANDLYDQFRPILWFEPGKPQALFHDVGHAWYHEFMNDPPKTVP
jgi:hypothetical protein